MVDSAYSLVASGLKKKFANVDALDGFDLEVKAGSIHGLLGPNGAGKSTAVKAFATLIELDAGTATVAGHDVGTHPQLVRRSIGLVGQGVALDEILGGRQNLVMFGRLYGLGKADAGRRADELLNIFGLGDAASRAVSTYSGGMKRRLDIAASLILTPAVLFLDEPTTGLDPRARNEVWLAVRAIAASGTTVLLTTQYLDEADQLADHISVMNNGRVIASNTPDALKRQIGGDRVVITFPFGTQWATAAAVIAGRTGAGVSTDEHARSLTVEASAGSVGLVEIVRALDAAGLAPDDVVLRRPTLDEVFLTLTAKEAA